MKKIFIYNITNKLYVILDITILILLCGVIFTNIQQDKNIRNNSELIIQASETIDSSTQKIKRLIPIIKSIHNNSKLSNDKE